MVELWLAVGVALATPREALDRGDAAWFAQDRRAARDAWREAAAGDDPAAEASARLRLILVSGTAGLMVQGPRAERAIAACPDGDPWCDLARAELELIQQELGLPADLGLAAAWARAAEPDLPGPALARQVWAGAPVERLEAVPRDALGEGLLGTGGDWPSGPGTWVLGLGVVGAPGLGVGGSLRFVHPDLAFGGHYLDLSALATSRGLFGLSGTFRSEGARWWLLSGQGSRVVLDLYGTDGERLDTEISGLAEGRAGPGLRAGDWSVVGGPVGRIDWTPEALAGHGAFASARWDGRASGLGSVVRFAAELALADYDYVRSTVDLREFLRVPGGVFGLRLLGDGLPVHDARVPTVRLPAAGGDTVLRGAPAGRYRGPWLVAAATEYRHPFGPVLSGAVFGELAWLPDSDDPGPHPGGGLGLRLALPPRPYNTLRLDLGVSDGGWGLAVGYGEAF